MELNTNADLCSVCHQAVTPQYYFCPNCGNKLKQAPLSTTILTQISIYAFSAILPMILFLFVTKWPGIKYLKSTDKKTKNIGIIACVILGLSTIVTIWLVYVWTQNTIKSSIDSINTDFGL